MDSTPYPCPPSPRAHPIPKVFEITDTIDFYEQLWRALSAKAEANNLPWAGLNECDRSVLSAWELQCEVNNGGFDQYFFNPSGEHAQEVVAALKLLGAVKLADIADRALAVSQRADLH